jgi:hypothetical protein
MERYALPVVPGIAGDINHCVPYSTSNYDFAVLLSNFYNSQTSCFTWNRYTGDTTCHPYCHTDPTTAILPVADHLFDLHRNHPA